MSRHLVLSATAALLLAGAARAQAPAKGAAPAGPAAPAPAAQATQPAPVDPKVEALVKAAVEKAKQEMREELKSGLQETQSRVEFLGTAAEGPKLQFLELDGYLRVRGDLLDNMNLRRGTDPNGEYLVPPPLFSDRHSGTASTANMRLRLEPTVNVSEHVRVRVQADVLDDYVLGATPGGPQQGAAAVDRPVIDVKRAWGEVETPVGLLSFGRMPAAFGLGLVHADAPGLDDDFGDNRDRLQFATLPLTTPGGPLSLVTFYDFDAEGTLQNDTRFGPGAGQPWDRDNGDDGRTIGIKLLRLDTDAELRRKLARGESSTNFGLMYLYSTQRMIKNPYWDPERGDPGCTTAPCNLRTEYYARKEYRHELSLWVRHRSPRLSIEAELAGVTGQIGDPGPYSATVDYPEGAQLLMRQIGGALRAAYPVAPTKVTIGGEIGFASGDSAPGFGNRPKTISPTATGSAPVTAPGVLEGPQYDPARGDHILRAFQFNPAYRVDLVLWREILGTVTDAFYFKPTVRWDVLSGLTVDGQIVYSQALSPSSTPSAVTGHPSSPLGIEVDTKVGYATDDGFVSWLQYGVLFPLGGFDGAGSLTRGHALRAGLAIKF